MPDFRTALWPCEVDVEIRGVLYTVPARPAADWLPAIVGEGGQSIIPGLLDPSDANDLGWRFKRGAVDPVDINRAWRDVLEAASGRSWWSTARLCQGAVHPDALAIVQGRLWDMGFDMGTASIAGLCNALFFLMVSGATDDAELSKAKFELEVPPPGEIKNLDPVQLEENFMAALAQFQELEPPS